MLRTTIAHYKITGKLGQGGMGEVCRPTNGKMDHLAAIKVVATVAVKGRSAPLKMEVLIGEFLSQNKNRRVLHFFQLREKVLRSCAFSFEFQKEAF
ncbi:MAG: hypothetical protein ACFHW5_06880 [Verrucomicrobiota bacterium]